MVCFKFNPFSKNRVNFYFMCIDILHEFVFVACVCIACGGQKKVLNSIELVLHMVVTHYVGSGNGTLGSLKSSKCS